MLVPAERCTDVVMVGLAPGAPGCPVGRALPAGILLGELDAPPEVTLPDLNRLPACLQLLQTVRSDRLEHRETGLAGRQLATADEAVRDQRLDIIENVCAEAPICIGDSSGGL